MSNTNPAAVTSGGALSASPQHGRPVVVATGGVSSSGANIPYLGSKISLISKAKIRYEGILYTIDPQQSTVALAKVRSYGTENRLVENPLPPKDEVYEYIIFRATDIEDLQVSEPPRATSLHEALPHMDPAIVQHAPPTYPNNAPNVIGPVLSQGSRASLPRLPSIFQDRQAVSQSGGAAYSLLNGVAVGGASAGSYDRMIPHQQGHQDVIGSNVRNQNFDGNRRRVRTVAPPNIFRQGGYQNRYGGLSSSGTGGGNSNFSSAQASGGQNYYYRRPPNRSGSFASQPGFIRSPRMRNRSMGGGALKFDGDFDFEKANEEFSKLSNKVANLNLKNGTSHNSLHQKKADEAKSKDGNVSPALTATTATTVETTSAQSSEEPSTDKRQQSSSPALVSSGSANGAALEGRGSQRQSQHSKTKTPRVAGAGAAAAECSTDDESLYYDKNKSFFDKISCEALEREKGKESRIRKSWQEERHQNAETFGTYIGSNGPPFYGRVGASMYANRGIGNRPGVYGGGRRYGSGPHSPLGGGQMNRFNAFSGGYNPSGQPWSGYNNRRHYYNNQPYSSGYYSGRSGHAAASNELPAWYYEMPTPQIPVDFHQKFDSAPGGQAHSSNVVGGGGGNEVSSFYDRRHSSDFRTSSMAHLSNPNLAAAGSGGAGGNNFSRRFPVYG